MARRLIGGSILPTTGTDRRRARSTRIATIVLSVVVVALLLFYGLGSWYFSGVLEDDALIPHPPSEATFDLTVTASGESEVTVEGETDAEHIDTPGTFGLAWSGDAAIVGSISAANTTDEGSIRVRRTIVDDGANPPVGADAYLDSYVWRGDPETAFAYPFREVVIDTDLGQLGAWHVPGSTDTWMIFVHGKGAPRDEALRLLPVAFDRGAHALVIDYRNDPGTTRDPSGYYQYGLTEWEDVAAAARFARSNGADDLVLVGYSMGGGIVASFLTISPLRNQVSAAILDAPNLSFEASVDHQAAGRDLVFGLPIPTSLVTAAKWISSWRFDIDWADYNILDRWREYHAPTLIFHGEADESVPIETSREFAGLRSDIVTLVAVENAGHVESWNADPAAYVAAVHAFLDEHTG